MLKWKNLLRQEELYWCHKLKTYAPFGLDEHDVYAVYYTRKSLHSLDVINNCKCLLFSLLLLSLLLLLLLL